LKSPSSIEAYAAVFEGGVKVLATAKAQVLEVVEMELIALMVQKQSDKPEIGSRRASSLNGCIACVCFSILQKDIYTSLVLPNLSLAPRSLLLSIPSPNISQEVSQLEATLGTVCAEKKHRSALRNFMDRFVRAARIAQTQAAQQNGVFSTSVNPLDVVAAKGGSVKDLEPLILPTRPGKPGAEDLSVGKLFG
jgi:hypothetical protein